MKKIAKFEKVSLAQFSKDFGKENSNSLYDEIKLPKRATKGSAGYDFYSPVDVTIQKC